MLLSTSNTVKAQFSRSASEEFDSDGFWSDNFRGMDDMNLDNFEFMPEFDFDSFFRKIDAPPLNEAQERSKNLHSVLKLPKTISLYTTIKTIVLGAKIQISKEFFINSYFFQEMMDSNSCPNPQNPFPNHPSHQNHPSADNQFHFKTKRKILAHLHFTMANDIPT